MTKGSFETEFIGIECTTNGHNQILINFLLATLSVTRYFKQMLKKSFVALKHPVILRYTPLYIALDHRVETLNEKVNLATINTTILSIDRERF